MSIPDTQQPGPGLRYREPVPPMGDIIEDKEDEELDEDDEWDDLEEELEDAWNELCEC
jgi:hypothetical protein